METESVESEDAMPPRPITVSEFVATVRRWRWAFYLAAALLVYAGFGFRTPEQQFSELRRSQADLARADTATNRRVDSLITAYRDERGQLLGLMRPLATLRCLDGTPTRDIQLSGLPCDSLLSIMVRARRLARREAP